MNEVFHCNSSYKRKPKAVFMRAIAFVAFAILSILLIYNFQLIPAIIPFAEAKTSTVITAEVQRIVRESIGDKPGTFVRLNYDENGNVVSLETNTALVASINSVITENVVTKLGDNRRMNISIPLGNLSGEAIFTGRGPDIVIPIVVSPKVTCDIKNQFYESGINQTLHRIVARISVETYALIPASPRKISVDTEYCIAETVIVGRVPDAYTKINRLNDEISESEIDDIYDFGASVD